MLNKQILIGRVGKDPEIRSLETGTKVANFSLATSETYKDKSGNKVEETEWHNVSFFGKLAEAIEKYVNKGDLLYIEGKTKTNTWEDKDKITRYSKNVIGNNMRMLGGKKDESAQSNQEAVEEIPPIEDDLPF